MTDDPSAAERAAIQRRMRESLIDHLISEGVPPGDASTRADAALSRYSPAFYKGNP